MTHVLDAERKTAARESGLIVLGMHRSGTSALTGALVQIGFAATRELMPATKFNVKGYWEDKRIVTEHNALLKALGSAWDSPAPLPDHWERSTRAAQSRNALASVLGEEIKGTDRWILKDPRICRLMPMWQEMLLSLGIAPRYVLIFRNPLEVAASLARRDEMPAERAAMLWLEHMVEAEFYTRAERRSIISYDRLMSEKAACLRRVDAELGLGLTWNQDSDDAIAGFLTDDLKHHDASLSGGSHGPIMAAALDLFGYVTNQLGENDRAVFDAAFRKTVDLALGFAAAAVPGAQASAFTARAPQPAPVRLPSAPPPGWSERSYLAANPDVADAVRRGAFQSGYQHYVAFGRKEGRLGASLPEDEPGPQ